MIAIDFDAVILREETAFVAWCPGLDVSSCGHDVEEARRNLRTAVRLFAEEAERMGTLHDILREAGYCERDGVWDAPRLVSAEVMSLSATA